MEGGASTFVAMLTRRRERGYCTLVGIAKSGVRGYLAGGDKAKRNTIYQSARSNSGKSIHDGDGDDDEDALLFFVFAGNVTCGATAKAKACMEERRNIMRINCTVQGYSPYTLLRNTGWKRQRRRR